MQTAFGKRLPTVSCVSTLSECDGRTDGHPTTAKTALTHSLVRYKKSTVKPAYRITKQI